MVVDEVVELVVEGVVELLLDEAMLEEVTLDDVLVGGLVDDVVIELAVVPELATA